MKKIEDILMIPKLKLFQPDIYTGVGRIHLRSTKHNLHARITYSRKDGIDMVMVMFPKAYFKHGVRPTPKEIDEVMHHFFLPEEIPQCEVITHPDNELISVIYRMQEVDQAEDGS